MDLIKKLEELKDDGAINFEERRPPYPQPVHWFDALDGINDVPVAGEDKSSGDIPEPAIKGKPQEDESNPLRRGDNSTII